MVSIRPTSPSLKIYLSTLIILCFLTINESYAQIASSRVTDWSKAGVVGGIPTGGSEIQATSYGIVADGRTDNTAAINNLLKSSASLDKVIKFPAGTIRCEGKLVFPSSGRRVLRGTLSSTGAKLTKFMFNTGATGDGNFVVQGSYTTSDIAVVGGYSKGSSQLTVATSSGLSAGDYIEIRQNNNNAIMNSYRSPDYSTSSRSIGQILRIASVNSTTITLQKPLRFSYNNGGDFKPTIRKFAPAQEVGFEDFYTECLVDGAKWTFRIARTANSWIKNVHSYKSVRVHVELSSCVNMTIRDSYFHDSFNHGNGGNGYGVLTTGRTTDCLIENNTFRRLRHAMMTDHGANGNVFGYNKSSEAYSSSFTNTPPDISVHGYYSYMNLFEGNLVENIHSADHWGPSGPGTTFFRNKVVKERLRIDDYSQDNNVVGNEVVLREIDLHSTTKGTFSHGNIVGSTTSWASGAGTDNVQNSYYLSNKPGFLDSSAPWPLYGPKGVAQTPAPATPVAAAATNIAENSFTANWNGATGAESYRLDVSTLSTFGSFVTGYQNKTVSATSQAISGLSSGTTYYFRVRAVNTAGTSSASNIIKATTLSESTANQAPIVANPIPDQQSKEGTAFTYTFPVAIFSDADGDALSYTASLSSGASLPSWLTFNAATRTFSGTPSAAHVGYLDVKVTATDNSMASAQDVFRLTVQSSGTTIGGSVMRINAGGGSVTNSLGTFMADKYFSPNPGNTYSRSIAIANTSNDAMYQTERNTSANHQAFSYNIPVTDGQYTVVLHFAEIYFTTSGKRVFDVSLEGRKVLDNYDIFRKAGALTAVTETFQATVTDGVLNLYFSSLTSDGGQNRPKVSAIEVLGGGASLSTTQQTPKVSITSPLNNASFSAPASINIAASASDSDGSITKVEFYKGTTKLGEDLTSPYNFTWNNVAAGTYSITTRATDNTGGISTSAAVAIQVATAPNQAPVANAGPDQRVTADASGLAKVQLNGAGSSDANGTISAYAWTLNGASLATGVTSAVSLGVGTHTITLKVTDNQGTVDTDQVVITVGAYVASSVYRINAGGGSVTNSLGTFMADKYFSPNPGNTYSRSIAIANTSNDAMYQTERNTSANHQAFSYNIPVTDGQYTVVLHFAEIYFTTSGKRVFDVSLEGRKVLDNYDIFRKAGALTAVTETFQVTVTDGVLNLYFSSLTSDGGENRPKVSAIEVFGAPTSPATVSATGTSTIEGTEEAQEARDLTPFIAYPNPVDDVVYVEANDNFRENVSIALVDQLGKQHIIMANGNLTDRVEINMSRLNLSSGLYLLVVTSNGKKEVIKLIKK